MKSVKKQPLIRFRGFTDDWEQRKLGEIAQITMGQSPNSENYTNNPSDNILVQGNADIINGRVTPRIWTTQITKQAEKDDLILSVRAPVGDIGKTDYDVVLGRGVAGVKGNEYVFQLLTKMKDNGYWNKLSTGSTFDSINSKDIKNAEVFIPREQEQEKIGLYLLNIDKLITLHKRKLELMKKLKKGLLQKAFPREKCVIPELRFKEFTDDWEQRKLGECFVERKERNGVLELLSVTIGSGVQKSSSIDRYYNSSKNKSNYKLVKVGDIVYNSMRMWQGASGVSSYDGIVSPAYTVLIPGTKIISNFFSYYFKTLEMLNKFQTYSQGLTSDTWNLKYNLLRKINIVLPLNIEEQNNIYYLLNKLDHLITLHQRKYEELEIMKKALLQKMFI